MECSCKGWKKSAEQIFALQATAAITRGVHYTGNRFKFCPWCGAKFASQSGVEADTKSRCGQCGKITSCGIGICDDCAR